MDLRMLALEYKCHRSCWQSWLFTLFPSSPTPCLHLPLACNPSLNAAVIFLATSWGTFMASIRSRQTDSGTGALFGVFYRSQGKDRRGSREKGGEKRGEGEKETNSGYDHIERCSFRRSRHVVIIVGRSDCRWCYRSRWSSRGARGGDGICQGRSCSIIGRLSGISMI